jgi:hypothetical protein
VAARKQGPRGRVSDAFDVVTTVNQNPIPREALPTGAIEALHASDSLATVEMPPLLRAELVKQPLATTGMAPLASTGVAPLATTEIAPLATTEIAPLAPPPPTPAKPSLAGTPWEPTIPAPPAESHADFAYPRHPRAPVWHYLVLGAAVASLVVVALSILTSLGFVSMGHH